MNNPIRVLITSGGTKIHIDSVRSITNMSKGTFGSKIADEFLELGCDVVFLHAKDSKTPVQKHNLINSPTFVTFEDYERGLARELLRKPDIIVLAAAVSDYGVENCVDGKIRSSNELIIKLKPLPKLISSVRYQCPNSTICGFKLLVNSTREILENETTNSLMKNLCDIVVGNDLSDIKMDNHRLIVSEWEDVRTTWLTPSWHNDMLCPTMTNEYSKSDLKEYCSLADVVARKCFDIHTDKIRRM